jgi:hypothetical protein
LNGNDIGMRESGCSFSLTDKALNELFILSKMWMHNLDCNFAIQASIKAFIDARHPTIGYLAKELIAPINEFAAEI